MFLNKFTPKCTQQDNDYDIYLPTVVVLGKSMRFCNLTPSRWKSPASSLAHTADGPTTFPSRQRRLHGHGEIRGNWNPGARRFQKSAAGGFYFPSEALKNKLMMQQKKMWNKVNQDYCELNMFFTAMFDSWKW